jgi:hypothetical protein
VLLSTFTSDDGEVEKAMQVFRSMKEAPDNFPEVGSGGRLLGVRPGNHATPDVLAVNPGDVVGPGSGGLSVAPLDPMYLQKHRRPAGLGGTGHDPVWCIETAQLSRDLQFRQDRRDHGLIEASRAMTLNQLEVALMATRHLWTIHCR